MIHRAKFQNFKALRDVEVTFDSRLTVLVGPNGSGKSSVLQGLEAISMLARGTPGDALADWIEETQNAYGGDGSRSLFLEAIATVEGTSVLCQFQATPTPKAEPDETWRFSTESELAIKKDGGVWDRREFLPLYASPFITTTLLRLSPEVIASPSSIAAIPPRMNTEGAGVASVLAYLDRVDRDKLAEIVDFLRSIIPQLEGVRPDFTQTSEGVKDSLRFNFHGVRNVRSQGASSGTLIALGLLTMLLSPKAPQVVLLDDLDRDLHPKAQMELIGVLRRVLSRYPDIQVIATSHSPYILDKLAWNEVRVTALNDDGMVVCKPLTEHPKYPMWKDSMSPGEFWSHGGEDWVKQLAPQSAAP